MLHAIKEIEQNLQSQGNFPDKILNKRNIYKLMSEQDDEKVLWEKADTEDGSNECCYQFLEKGFHMQLWDILLDTCLEKKEFDDVVQIVSEKCETMNIDMKNDDIKKYICKAVLYGLIEIGSTQKIHIEGSANTSYDNSTLERMYLVECLLCEIIDKVRAPHDGRAICLLAEKIHFGRYKNLLKRRTLRSFLQIQELEKYKEKCETIQELQKFSKEQIDEIEKKGKEEKLKINEAVSESVKENTKEFYKNNMEIIGIFLAVFSIIGFNLFSNADIEISTVLLLTVSCVLGIVIMFMLIEQIINKKIKVWHFLLTILILAILLFKLAKLEV